MTWKIPAPLEKAGVDHFFDRHFSVEAVQKSKPSPETYQYVARELAVQTADLRWPAIDVDRAQARRHIPLSLVCLNGS